jgi:adenine nucleotide transporter 17
MLCVFGILNLHLNACFFKCCQGIYYFFYQIFKNKAVAIAAARKVKGHGDGTVGMFGWLIVAAIAG